MARKKTESVERRLLSAVAKRLGTRHARQAPGGVAVLITTALYRRLLSWATKK